jgi:large conductance mechanosensitive channel
MKDFKAFAMRGNMIDLAIGVVIGGAFGKIIASLVNDVIMPPIGMLLGGMNFTALAITLKPGAMGPDGKIIEPVLLKYGAFIQSTVDFLIIAFCIFMLINTINRFKAGIVGHTPAPTPSEILLREIRDILKERKQ